MRSCRSRGLLLFFPLASVTGLACFSPSSGGKNVEFDASFDAGFFDGSAADTEPVEAAADVTAADVAAEAEPIVDASVDHFEAAAPQPITVIVAGALGYEQGVNVVFGDATGTPVATAVTNAQGIASTVLPTVTMVTVLLGTPNDTSPYTVMDLSPGMQVPVVDLASVSSLAARRVELTAIPTTPSLGAVSQYYASTGGCFTYYQAPPVYLPFSNGSGLPCVGLAPTLTAVNPVLPLVLEAVDTSNTMLGFALSTSASPSMPDDAGTVELALNGAWTPAGPTTSTDQLLDVANVPDGGQPPQVTYSEVADGILSPLQARALPADAGAAPLLHVQTHIGFGQGIQAEALWVTYPPTGATVGSSVVTSAIAPSTSGTLTLDATVLASAPSFQTGATAAGPTAARPIIQWTLASGDLGGATGLVTNVGWTSPLDGGGYQNGSWTIVSAGTKGTSVTVPALPPSLAAYAPNPGSFVVLNEIYAVYGQTSMTTYASTLPIGSLFQFQPCSISGPQVPPLPGPGTAFVVAFAPGSQC